MKNYMIGLMLIGVLATTGLWLGSTQKVQAQSPHSVALSWTAGTQPTGVVVTLYNIYRSSTPGGEVMGGAHVGTTSPPTTTYTDSTVTANTTYYYTVTAWCNTCAAGKQESPFSNEFKAVVPADVVPPNSPTGLTGVVQ